MKQSLGFRGLGVQGLGFRVVGFRDQGLGFCAHESKIWG